MKGEIDYRYTLDLYKRICSLQVDGKAIHDLFVIDGYNYWHFYEQRIFEEVKRFSAEKSYHKPTLHIGSVLKDIVLFSFIILFSLIAFLYAILSRSKVLIYSIDRVNASYKNDFRLNSLYQVLHDEHISYIEILHTIIGRNTISNIFKRGRVVSYLEGFDAFARTLMRFGYGKGIAVKFSGALNLSDFSEDEKDLVNDILSRYKREVAVSYFKVSALRRLLRLTSIETCFAIDDARYFYEILLACKLAGVKTYALQHGHFTKYHVGWRNICDLKGRMVSPDRYLVWSSYWKDQMLKLGYPIEADRVMVAAPKIEERDILSEHERIDGNITVLIPYETACPKNEVGDFIRRLLEDKKVMVVFKLRPDREAESQIEEYGLAGTTNTRLQVVTDVSAVLDSVDVVIGVYSTFLYDMVVLGKPVAILEATSDYGYGMVQNGLAEMISPAKPLREQLLELRHTSREELVRRKQLLIGKEKENISSVISSIVNKKDIYA